MLGNVLLELNLNAPIFGMEVPDEETGKRRVFAGSPTIRFSGVDVEPGWQECEDCAPRCRVYPSLRGFSGLPEREWVVAALRSSTT